jgi:hypothetical protein
MEPPPRNKDSQHRQRRQIAGIGAHFGGITRSLCLFVLFMQNKTEVFLFLDKNFARKVFLHGRVHLRYREQS